MSCEKCTTKLSNNTHTIPYHTIPYHTIPYHTIPHTLLLPQPRTHKKGDKRTPPKVYPHTCVYIYMVREPLQALYCALGVKEGYMCVYSGKRSHGRVTPNPPNPQTHTPKNKNMPPTPFPPNGAKVEETHPLQCGMCCGQPFLLVLYIVRVSNKHFSYLCNTNTQQNPQRPYMIIIISSTAYLQKHRKVNGQVPKYIAMQRRRYAAGRGRQVPKWIAMSACRHVGMSVGQYTYADRGGRQVHRDAYM